MNTISSFCFDLTALCEYGDGKVEKRVKNHVFVNGDCTEKNKKNGREEGDARLDSISSLP